MTAPTNPAVERQLELARGIVRPFEGREGVIGALMHGSSARPYADEGSDVDLIVVVADDALATIAAGQAHQKLWEGGRKLADLSFHGHGELSAPRFDLDHFRAVHARIVFDTGGQLAALLARLAALPSDVRDERMRVHYFEVAYLSGKLQAAQRRKKVEAVAVLKSQLVVAAAKLLFLERGSWPGPMSWIFEDLEIAGVSADLRSALRGVLDAPEPKVVRAFRGRLDEYLLACGAAFVSNPEALLRWIYESPEGRAATARWSWPLQVG